MTAIGIHALAGAFAAPAVAGLWITLMQVVFVIACILLCFIILIQPAKGEGIASAFAGVGSESFFGTKAHQSMSRFTIGLSVVVLVIGILINGLREPAAPEENPDAPLPPAAGEEAPPEPPADRNR